VSPSLMRRMSTVGKDTFHTATIKGERDAASDGNAGTSMSNYVATTKYSMLTFLPKALYEQVRPPTPPAAPPPDSSPHPRLSSTTDQGGSPNRAATTNGQPPAITMNALYARVHTNEGEVSGWETQLREQPELWGTETYVEKAHTSTPESRLASVSCPHAQLGTSSRQLDLLTSQPVMV
jgi:hypothetical protein